MSYVAFCRDKAVVADDGSAGGAYSAVDDHILADNVVITDMAIGAFPFPTEVLWVGSDDGALVNFIVFAHAGALDDTRVGHDFAIVANLYIGIDISEWMNDHILSDFG